MCPINILYQTWTSEVVVVEYLSLKGLVHDNAHV